MIRKHKKSLLAKQGTVLLLILSQLAALTACGGNSAKATTMHLTRTSGQVAVSDGDGEDVALLENLGLYSGYGVDTRRESFAWIDLDSVKLTKMDQNSEIAIQKEDKQLEIEVKSGSLFFNVTEPLAEDETMDIRSSSMVVGIRGTCGWVEVPDESQMNLYLLEGKVECSAGSQTSQVSAGEMASMTENGQIEVQPFTAKDVPAFIVEEVELDSALAQAILEASGLDILHPAGPVELALEQYRAIVSQADTYDYDSADEPTGAYRYALVPMTPGAEAPALLLEQDTAFGISSILVFQYDTDSDSVLQAADTLSEGVGGAGGYRGSLSAAGDGNGLLSTEFSSGTGMGSTSRTTLDGDRLRSEVIWEGNIFDDTDMAADEIGFLDIDWHDIGDTAALDSWTPGAAPAEPAPTEPEDAQDTEPAQPTDGDRIVFTGTLGAYSYSDVLALQEIPDPNPGSDQGETYWLIVLDTPQGMTLRSGDGSGSYEGEVSLIDVTGADGLEQYIGQSLTVSIDADDTWWPSDTSLPMGQPRTSDVNVLQ